MSLTCWQHVITTQHFAPILARWAGVADTKLKMLGPFVPAWADILISRQKPDQPKCICRNILWYGSYIRTDMHPHALNALFWASIVRLSKKDKSWWQKGRELAVKLGYGMTVLVAWEEERGEVDMYMVLSSYYYNMYVGNSRHDTAYDTEKKPNTAWCWQCVSYVGPLCREDTKTCLQN